MTARVSGKLRGTMTFAKTTSNIKPLSGVRILSLALNLPGPAAVMRLRTMGAKCTKLEPPTGDPMHAYKPSVYDTLQEGVRVISADLRTPAGQKTLHRELARAQVLITSFRPSALIKLGLTWKTLHKAYPSLAQVAVVGSHGERAEEPGHDLTYMAEMGLVSGLELPPTLFADMGGSLMVSEAVLQAVLHQTRTGKGAYLQVALVDAAAYLALPRSWDLTTPGKPLAGAHAGYRLYPCKDGRVAVAALEPHFALALCQSVGIDQSDRRMEAPATHAAIAKFFAGHTCSQITALGTARDIPVFALPDEVGMSKGNLADEKPTRTNVSVDRLLN